VSEPDRPLPRAGRAAATLVVAAQIAAAAIGIRESAPAAFENRPFPVIPAAQNRDIRFIRGWIPDDEPLLYLTDGSDSWTPRTWERALSPEPVAFVITRDFSRTAALLRRRFGIRWAISAGTPPADPGFAWHWPLAPLPGGPAQYWFGRLSD
jgi:hypothetical protein